MAAPGAAPGSNTTVNPAELLVNALRRQKEQSEDLELLKNRFGKLQTEVLEAQRRQREKDREDARVAASPFLSQGRKVRIAVTKLIEDVDARVKPDVPKMIEDAAKKKSLETLLIEVFGIAKFGLKKGVPLFSALEALLAGHGFDEEETKRNLARRRAELADLVRQGITDERLTDFGKKILDEKSKLVGEQQRKLDAIGVELVASILALQIAVLEAQPTPIQSPQWLVDP